MREARTPSGRERHGTAASPTDERSARRAEARRRVEARFAAQDLAAREAGSADFMKAHDSRTSDERKRAERPLYADEPADGATPRTRNRRGAGESHHGDADPRGNGRIRVQNGLRDEPSPAPTVPRERSTSSTRGARNVSNPALHRVHVGGVQFGSENATSSVGFDMDGASNSVRAQIGAPAPPQRASRRSRKKGAELDRGWTSGTGVRWSAQGPNTAHRGLTDTASNAGREVGGFFARTARAIGDGFSLLANRFGMRRLIVIALIVVALIVLIGPVRSCAAAHAAVPCVGATGVRPARRASTAPRPRRA